MYKVLYGLAVSSIVTSGQPQDPTLQPTQLGLLLVVCLRITPSRNFSSSVLVLISSIKVFSEKATFKVLQLRTSCLPHRVSFSFLILTTIYTYYLSHVSLVPLRAEIMPGLFTSL